MARTSRIARPVRVEPMEPRRLCDASQLTELVTSATATGVSSASALSAKATVVVDNRGAALKEAVEVDVYASATPLVTSGPVDGNYLLGSKRAGVNLAAGGTATFTVPLKAKPGVVPDGAYTLYAVVSDKSGGASVANAGPPFAVAAPVITLAPSESIAKLPATVAAGGKLSAVDKVRIDNTGTDASAGEVTVAVYASPDGRVSDGTAIGDPLVRKMNIPAGKAVTVAVPLRAFPAVAAGAYHLVTQVTDPNGVVTTADSATITVPPAVAGTFSAAVTAAKVKDLFDPDTSVITQSVTLTLAFANTGSTAIAGEPLTITAYRSDTATGGGTLIGQATVALSAKPRGKVRAVLTPTAEKIATHGGGVSVAEQFIVVTVTDATGAVQTVAYPKQVRVDE